MGNLIIIKHLRGAPGIRFFGMGPYLIPSNSLKKLQSLFNKETFWARNRSIKNLKIMLANSSEVISIWKDTKLIGFGRATSDKVYRAVLWDIVVSKKYQREGVGKLLVNALLETKSVKNVEKIYLMSTKRAVFYEKQNFLKVKSQKLLIHTNDKHEPN